MPINRAASAPTSGGECITPEIVAPRGEHRRCAAPEARISAGVGVGAVRDIPGLQPPNVSQISDLFPKSETEPTRVRRMRGEVPQKDDPSEAMMSEAALNGTSAPEIRKDRNTHSTNLGTARLPQSTIESGTGGCITWTEVFGPRVEDGGCDAPGRRSSNNTNHISWTNDITSKTEPTRARRMRSDTLQQDDPF